MGMVPCFAGVPFPTSPNRFQSDSDLIPQSPPFGKQVWHWSLQKLMVYKWDCIVWFDS